MAKAGSRLMSVPNAAAVRRCSASISRVNGMAGNRMARPRPANSRCGVRWPMTDGPATMVTTSPATGMDTASPVMPVTSSPTRWVSRM